MSLPVYERLRALAAGHLARERPDHTLQATALVHETWLRLRAWRGSDELARLQPGEVALLASTVMRRVLTDHARARGAAKRDAAKAPGLQGAPVPDASAARAIVDVDDALRDLAEQDAELARLVELRFFGGCTLPEIAELTGCSLRTANRRWQLARAWLIEALDAR